MKFTVLGSGSSFGTPAAGGFWGKCDPDEPRNHRTRASLLAQSKKTNLIIDASYDIRTQLNRIELKDVHGLLLTHDHSDHVNGIDDLRSIAINNNKIIDIYSSEETIEEVNRRWPYLFEDREYYVQFFKRHAVKFYDGFRVGDIDIQTFEQDHTTCKSMGYRFGDFAYSVDVADLSEAALEALKGVKVWMIDGSAYNKESVMTHANLTRVRKWVEILKPDMTYVTVLTTHMDYKTLCGELPPHIRPAYDGLEIDMGASNLR